MLSLDKKLADKIGSNFIIANEGTGAKKKSIHAITSNYLKCKPCIFPDRPDKLLEREDWLRFIRKYRLSNADVRKLRSTWTLPPSKVKIRALCLLSKKSKSCF